MPTNKKKKGGSQKRKDNAQQQAFSQAATRAAARLNGEQRRSYGILQAVDMNNTALQAATRVQQRLITASQNKNDEITVIWRVYIRRANIWCGVDGCKKRRIEPKCRPWWITFILGNDLETVRTVMVEDASAIAKNPAQHALTANMFLAALESVMNDVVVTSPPNKLVLWPSQVFRVQSIRQLIQQLEPILMLPSSSRNNILSVETLPGVSDPSDDRVGGCVMQAVLPTTTTTTTMDLDEQHWYTESDVTDYIECQLQQMEQSMMAPALDNRSGYIPRSFATPCVTQHESHAQMLTIYQLRLLFDAAKQFHNAKPWETLTNFDPVEVTVPINLEQQQQQQDVVAGKQMTRKYFCVVAGNGSWDARGVYFYKSWNDLILASSSSASTSASSTSTASLMEQYSLMYWSRTTTPFRTLDHMEELGLALSTKDGSDGEESYPCLFSMDKNYADFTEEDHLKIVCNVPPVELFESLALAMLAIAQFTMTKCRTNVDGGTRTALAYGPVDLDVGSLIFTADKEKNLAVPGAAATATTAAAAATQQQRQCMVTVKCRSHEDARAFRYADDDSEKHMATLSVGDVRMCNYCQKPEKLLQQEMPGSRLLSCSRCKAIFYCSKRCQASDWNRHKKKECQPAVSKTSRSTTTTTTSK